MTKKDLLELGCSEELAYKLGGLYELVKERKLKSFYSYRQIENNLLRYTKMFGHINEADNEWANTFISSIQPLYGI